MLEEDVEHVPVVEDGALVGICTRTDLFKLRRAQLELERSDGRRSVA
jgi:CBS domain-containing protein